LEIKGKRFLLPASIKVNNHAALIRIRDLKFRLGKIERLSRFAFFI
tara:strand:+ start:6019 stop:6156 length:138 start_codon:yes stop_codon:yes gene_type:complete